MKKVMLVMLIFLIILNFVSAKNISLQYPEEVNDEEFKVKLLLIDFPEDTYDVKIDLLDNGVRVADILNNGEWKSTYYYINNIIQGTEEKEFSLKIKKNFATATIEVRIKDSKEKSSLFTGYQIKYESSSPSPPSENQTQETAEENTTETPLEEIQTDSSDDGSTTYFGKTNEAKNASLTLIKLNSQNIKTEKEDNKSYAIYGLVGFCILLSVLYLIKIKSRKSKNEFR